MTAGDHRVRILLDLSLSESEMLRQLRDLDARQLPARPPRRMPTLWALARYWAGREPFCYDAGDVTVPFCFGCGYEAPYKAGDPPAQRWAGASGRLERAHLVDRFLGGLDGPQNIVPLCVQCHRVMPMFDIDQGDAALEWVTGGGWFGMALAVMQDAAD